MYGSSYWVYGFVPKTVATNGNETVPNIYKRLLEFNNHVNTFIGGFKTFEEIFTTTSWSQQNKYKKPIGLLNINNF